MTAKLSAEEIKRLLDLQPLPGEGGFFFQTYISADVLPQASLPQRYTEDKAFSTAIYYLLTPDSFSALHRLPTDEVYHFYLGDPVEMLQLLPDGSAQRLLLGPDLAGGQRVQHVVPRQAWQGSRLLPSGQWALLGTTMAPAFTPQDFELGDAGQLAAQYLDQADLIRQLSR